MSFQSTKKRKRRNAQRRLSMVVLIVVINTSFFLQNRQSSGDAWALTFFMVNTLYCFLSWLISERVLSRIGRRYPSLEDTRWRILIKIAAYSGINSVLVSLTIAVQFALGLWQPNSHWLEYSAWHYGIICLLGNITITVYEGLYLFRKWKTATIESEQLKREYLQTQLDSLKNQVNPHFLFNSLNSLSSLIEDDEQPKAQLFISELARVYRYLLQSNEHELIPVTSELVFIEAYFFLLKTRFDNGISLHVDVSEAAKQTMIPPLTLQLLVENAVKHNVISNARPLKISIYTDGTSRESREGDDRLVVSNNVQSKTATISSNSLGLDNIAAKYRLLSGKEPTIRKSATTFTVTLPLLSAAVLV